MASTLTSDDFQQAARFRGKVALCTASTAGSVYILVTITYLTIFTIESKFLKILFLRNQIIIYDLSISIIFQCSRSCQ